MVSLVPSTQFRLGFRASHRLHREPQLSTEAQTVLHQVYTALLRLLGPAKHYTDMQQHGTMKLTTYFALLMYCCIGRTEKLMVSKTTVLHDFIFKILRDLVCSIIYCVAFTVWTIFYPIMAFVPPETFRTFNTSSSQQTSSFSVLEPRVHRLSRKCTINASKRICNKEYRLQLHPVGPL